MSEQASYSDYETNLIKTAVKTHTSGKKRYYSISESDELYRIFKEKLKDTDAYSLIKDHNIKFQLNYVYPVISKTTLAHIYRVSEKQKIITDVDYVIEVSGFVWECLDEATKLILMEHELKHLHITETEEGQLKKRLINHDCQDFVGILSKYGLDWAMKNKYILEQTVERIKELAAAEKEKNKKPAKKKGRNE